jgi:cell division septation protein DedD
MYMKRIISITTLALLLATPTWAATPTPTTATNSTATPTPTSHIDDLKERLATKVAELRQTQQKAIYGTVKTTTVSTFTVETDTRDLKIELTDDIDVFQMVRGKRTALTTEDIAESDLVTVFGEYDSALDLLRAKVVFIQSAPLARVSGIVSAVDRKEFTTTVTTAEGQAYIIDIETTTNTLAFDAEKGLIKGGFSRIEIGKTIHVVGTAVAKEDHRISASRIIDLGNLTGDATPTPTEAPTPTASASATPKATTTTKATPTVTPKPTTTQ